MQEFAAIFADLRTIIAICLVLVGWTAWSAWRLRLRTDALIRALRASLNELPAVGDQCGFSDRFEETRAKLETDPLLGGRWRGFAASLIVPSDEARPIRRTSSPRAWFDMGLLRSAKLHTRYHAAMPSMLVGVGLFITFLGLAIALSSAGDIVGAGQSVDRTAALKRLLDTASAKFVTSLAGLALSLCYVLYRNRRLRMVEHALDGLVHRIESLIPQTSPAQLQEEANLVLLRQAEQLDTFSHELAVNIGQRIDTALDTRLGDHIGPLSAAMSSLAETMKAFSGGMADHNQSAVERMLETFLERLQGGTGDQMQKVAETLGGLGTRLEGLQSGLSDAAVRMAQSADAMAARMGEGAEAALSRITDQIGGLAETLRHVAEQTRESGSEAGREMAARIQAAAEGFENAAQGVAQTIARAAEEMERQMRDQGAASAGRLAAQMETAIGELRALAEASRAAGTQAVDALGERIARAADGFEASAAKVADALGNSAAQTGDRFDQGAKEAVDRIAAATEGMRTALQEMLAGMQGSLASAGDTLRESGVASADVLRTTLSQSAETFDQAVIRAADYLSAAGTGTGDAIRHGGEAARERIETAAAALGTRTESVGGQIAAAGTAAERIAAQVAALEQVTREASDPLSTAAAAMRAAGDAAREATRPLEATAARLSAAAEQTSGLAQRMSEAQTGTSSLITALTSTTQRFAGLDEHLGATLGQLQHGLQAYQQRIREFSVQTDENLSKSITQLVSLVNGLQETLDELQPVLTR